MKALTSASILALWALAGPAGATAAAGPDRPAILAQAATPLEVPPVLPAPAAPATPAQPVPSSPPAEAAPGAPDSSAPALTPGTPDPGAGSADDTPDTELSLGEIPSIETMELTADVARRALDSYLAAKVKYADTDLDQYENLQDFVDQTEDGKKFEADVKAAGFANVTEWNLAITTLGLTYSSVSDDQTADLKQQIKEVEADTELAQDIKDRMIKALNALIPSDNNKKVVEDMIADPVYGGKLKQLDLEEE